MNTDIIKIEDDLILGYARICMMIGRNCRCRFCNKYAEPPATIAEQNETISHFKNDCPKFKDNMDTDYIHNYINFYVEKEEIRRLGRVVIDEQYKHYKCMTCNKDYKSKSQLKRHICRYREDKWEYIEALEAENKLKYLKTDYNSPWGGYTGEICNIIVSKTKYNALMGSKWDATDINGQEQKRSGASLKWIVGYIEREDVDEEGEDITYYERCIVYKRDMRLFGSNLAFQHKAGSYPCNYITGRRDRRKDNYRAFEWSERNISVNPSRWEQEHQDFDGDLHPRNKRMIFTLSYTEKLVLDEMWDKYKEK